MNQRQHSEPSRRGWQVATAALIVLASVACDCNANAAAALGTVGAGGVSALVIDPHTGSTLYAAAFCGGVMRSADGGSTWSAGDTGLTGGYVSVIAIDPTTPGTLYAGTRFGVFKSTDSGATWNAANTGLTANLTALAIDPTTPSTLYALSNEQGFIGVFKSTNSGRTWSATSPTTISVDALAIDPTTPGTLYATSGGWLSKSTDSGASWNQSAAYTGLSVTDLAIDPTTPSTLYAAAYNYASDSNGVFKSTDGGVTWPVAGTGLPPFTRVNAVAIDPTTPGTLYAIAGGVFKSTDSGASWSAASAGLPPDAITGLAIDPTTTNTLYAGTYSGGVFKSTDGGNTWGTTSLRGGAICGDGLRCGGEVCDDGNLLDGDGCDSNCTPTACGNRIVTPPEQCDDGNLFDGDGCDSKCTVVPHCGNGILDAGEECDDGNRNPYDGCTNNCTICGNGIVTPPEECDDGNTKLTDGCTTACTICGNGIVTVPEGCDDGNRVDGDGCAATCIVPNVCGNAVREAGEECDDGGLCIGGTQAGTFCTADTQCPGGACTTFGGDGCAANCTTESEVTFTLVPGVLDGLELAPGTSGQMFYSDYISLPLPLGVVCYGGDNTDQPCTSDADCPGGTCVRSQETLTIGKERDGHIPVVIKATAVHLARMLVSNLACFCPRAVAAKTCGGTMFEPDGVTPSPDCTPGFTAGDSVCAGKPPCTFVHGPGNAAAGVIGCNDLDGINVGLTQDSGGGRIAQPPLITLSGRGPAGSAVLFAHTAIGGRDFSPNDQIFLPPFFCTGSDPWFYGPDGEFCTDDDPQWMRSSVSSTVLTTGTASATVLNANGGDTMGPFSTTGHPFSCSLLADGSTAGAALASVSVTVHEEGIGDSVTTTLLATAPPPACVGDCHGDGQVTIDELLTMVNLALGSAQPPACAAGVPSGAGVDIALIIQAVNHALNGCGG